MLSFVWPWLLLILPLPWFIRRFMPAHSEQQLAALRVPFMAALSKEQHNQFNYHTRLPVFLAGGAWCLLLIATAQPQWLGEAIEVPVSGRDLMLAVDLSGSMQEKDFLLGRQQVDRLTATKKVAGEFIDRRVGDRIGLILFGDQAYLQAPLSFDRTTIKQLLMESAIGLAGQKTAIGDAIGLAVKRLRQHSNDKQVLILLTDGANTAGEVEPLRAAQLAADSKMRIHTIGIGADEMIVRSLFGNRKVNPSVDLDEKTLRAMATQTGGQYFRARNTQELEKIYALLDKLEPVESDNRYFRPVTSLYIWPLGAALLISLLISLMRISGKMV